MHSKKDLPAGTSNQSLRRQWRSNHPAGGQATATGHGPSREPPAPSGLSVWPSATRPGGGQSRAVVKGGQRSSFPSWAFPARGRGETRRWRLSARPRLRQRIRGPLPLASPPRRPQPASQPLTWQKLRQ